MGKGKGAKKKTSQPDNKKEDINIADFFRKSKVPAAYLLILVFLVIGFYLRFYHIQYPVVGYHNWKVAHYITEARNFARDGFFKYGFFVPMRDTTESTLEPPDGEHNDTFPTAGIVSAILFRIFGESLVVARLAMIFFSLASVAAFYLFIKELFEREDLALLSVFLAAINPMYVFFSHNVDVINPGLLFMLLGGYFYVRWLKQENNINLYLASFCVMFGTITKYTFVVIAIPMALTFPYRKVFSNLKRYMSPLVIAAVIFSGFPLWFAYSEIYVKKFIFGRELTQNVLDSYEITKLVDFSIVWSPDFWATMKSYVADNFTLLGMFFAFLGSLLLLFLFFTKNRAKFGYKFMASYIFATFVFLFVMGFKLSGHNYHQFPIAPLVIFLMAFILVAAANTAASMAKDKTAKSAVKIIAILLMLFVLPVPGSSLYTKSMESKNRMFDTQFPGLDIAGEYINSHSSPGERMFHSSGQSFGVLWHAGMRGYKPPRDAAYFAEAENKYNVSWVFVYQWGMQTYFSNPEIFDYIKNNYKLVQFGFVPSGQQVQPLFFLFRKGGTFNDSELNSMLQDKPVQAKPYYYTSGQYEVRFINIE